MATKYYNCVETAKLMHKVLKEAFPEVIFSVTNSIHGECPAITVSWVDGPSVARVEVLTKLFEASY